MQRSELLGILNIVKQGLSDKDFLAIFQHFIFDKETIIAYNDTLGVSVNYSTQIDCAVPGKLLLGFLNSSSSEELTLELLKAEVVGVCGSFDFSLPILPLEQSIYKRPAEPKHVIEVTKKILNCIGCCKLSIDTSSALAELNCIHYFPKLGRMWSTNGATISKYEMEEIDTDFDGRLYLTDKFCEALSSFVKGFLIESFKLEIYDDCVVADFGQFGHIYSKQPAPEQQLDFEDALARTLNDSNLDYIPIPPLLKEALNRAQLLVSDSYNTTSLSIVDGQMDLTTKSANGVVTDSLPAPDHGQIDTLISASLLSKPLALTEFMCVTDGCVVMTDGDVFFHYIANRG